MEEERADQKDDQSSSAPAPDEKNQNLRRRMVIVGAGQTGRSLVRLLSAAWDIAILDTDQAKLDALKKEVPDRPIRAFNKDGTSLINLREAGIEGAEFVAALTNVDEVNIETCRVALSVEQPPTAIGILRQPKHLEKLKEVGAVALTRPAAISGLVFNQIERGQQVAINVGLGRGEIVEIPVLPTSPAVDVRVADLRAGRWLVAAIYRGDKFMVPHGNVVIRNGDRLLLTGDPDILPHIGDYLRAGVARFPLQYGIRIVAIGEAPFTRTIPKRAGVFRRPHSHAGPTIARASECRQSGDASGSSSCRSGDLFRARRPRSPDTTGPLLPRLWLLGRSQETTELAEPARVGAPVVCEAHGAPTLPDSPRCWHSPLPAHTASDNRSRGVTPIRGARHRSVAPTRSQDHCDSGHRSEFHRRTRGSRGTEKSAEGRHRHGIALSHEDRAGSPRGKPGDRDNARSGRWGSLDSLQPNGPPNVCLQSRPDDARHQSCVLLRPRAFLPQASRNKQLSPFWSRPGWAWMDKTVRVIGNRPATPL